MLGEFRRLLEHKRDLLEQVYEKTRRQPDLIASGNTDALLQNIADRQRLIDALDSVQGEVPDREALKSDPACAELAQQISRLLQDIQKQDSQNEQVATDRMQELSGQLQRLRKGKRGVTGYGAVGDVGATYFNKKN